MDEALALAPVAAVQVALSPYEDRSLRGGVVERCTELGISLIAHSPLGGPRRAGGLARQQELVEVADARGVTAAEVALTWLLELSPAVVAIPGARRPETARSAARAATFALDAGDRAVLARAFGGPRPARAGRSRTPGDADVVLLMGIPGTGKSCLAETYVARGYVRLNRDERGGSLREVAHALDEELSAGVRRIVLDNTYLTRAARSYVIEAASRHRVPTRCVWLDTPLAQAQSPEGTREALATSVARLSAAVAGPVESALCPHAAGPPSCWCRPPLPGLPLAFARAHGVDTLRSILVGTGPAHRTLATTLGARYVPV